MWPFSPSYPEVAIEQLQEEYDYIVVGGGTAGCALAHRLSTSPAHRVLLVERGPVADTWASRVPLFSSDFASDGTRTIRREMVPQKELVGRDGKRGSRAMLAFSGGVMGGTSRINQMLFTRGLPGEYDAWEKEAGVNGWGWESVRACALRSEKADVSVEGVHSQDGLWKNRHNTGELYFRGFKEAVKAAEKLGLPYIPDVNSPTHPPFGCARLHFTLDENAHRHSTYHAFLPLEVALERKDRLHICTNTIVERLVTERTPSGKIVVTGVTLGPTVEGKEVKRAKTVKAKKEVVLCAGPFGSPQILMLSGIGAAKHLEGLGITVVQDLPAVGSNLQDHFGVSTGFNISMSDSLLSLETRPWVFLIELIRYLIWGTGLLLVPVLQLAVFTHSKLLDEKGVPSKTEKAFDEKLPDIEIMPMAYESQDTAGSGIGIPRTAGTYSFLSVLLAPASRGTVRLSSADPRAPLVVDPAYLSNAADFVPLRAAVRLSLRMRDTMRANGYAMRDATVPRSERDEDLDEWIRRANRTTYHYSSTCRMGRRDDGEWEGGAVVDERLRVYGVGGVRVADSSVFPWVPRTHTQAPSVLVAEKCAEMMLEEV